MYAKDKHKRTPLMYACAVDCVGAATLLIQASCGSVSQKQVATEQAKQDEGGGKKRKRNEQEHAKQRSDNEQECTSSSSGGSGGSGGSGDLEDEYTVDTSASLFGLELVHVVDSSGVRIMYDCSLSDMRVMEQLLLSVGTRATVVSCEQ